MIYQGSNLGQQRQRMMSFHYSIDQLVRVPGYAPGLPVSKTDWILFSHILIMEESRDTDSQGFHLQLFSKQCQTPSGLLSNILMLKKYYN